MQTLSRLSTANILNIELKMLPTGGSDHFQNNEFVVIPDFIFTLDYEHIVKLLESFLDLFGIFEIL